MASLVSRVSTPSRVAAAPELTRPDCGLTAVQKLAVAVFRVAVLDLHSREANQRRRAAEFLTEGEAGVRFWSDVAGVPYEAVRYRAIALGVRREGVE